jgi:protein phosphatase
MPSVVVDVIGESDIGLVRERNEDVFLVADLARRAPEEGAGGVHALDVGERGLLMMVCDGMGGAAAGDRASHLASETFLGRLGQVAPRSREELAHTMGEAILLANDRIRRAGEEDRSLQGMGTTLTAAIVLDGVLVVAHVGDSRAYLMRDGQLVQLTEDQSLVQELVASGKIRREEAATYEHSNVILQALGVTEDLIPFAAEVPLRAGDLLLLCTDGLTTMVPQDEMLEVLASKGQDLAAAATALTAQARVHGGHDNITLVLARFRGDGLDAAGRAIEVRPVALGLRARRRSMGLSPLSLVVIAVLLMLAVAGVIILLGMD